MQRTRVLILGGGVSGLSLAWFLSRRAEPLEITLLERQGRLGNWIQTDRGSGYLFEQGPHGFKASRAGAILQLVQQLGMEGELLYSTAKRPKRYVLLDQTLTAVPSSPLALLTSPLTRGLLSSLAREWRAPPSGVADESIWEFARRRFGEGIARMLVDPLTVGIYGADCRALSVRSCFPTWKRWEEQYGSVIKGGLRSVNLRSDGSFFSFRNGVGTLISALASRLSARVLLNQEVESVRFHAQEVEVHTQRDTFVADVVYSTLPPWPLAKLLQAHDPALACALSQIGSCSMTIVNLGFVGDLLPYKGFGYLIPTWQQQGVLGALFDSNIFPEQSPGKTRITLHLAGSGASDEEALCVALRTLRETLRISASPDRVLVKKAASALPLYAVGHEQRLQPLRCSFSRRCARFQLVGNYLSGISVNDAIEKAILSSALFATSGVVNAESRT